MNARPAGRLDGQKLTMRAEAQRFLAALGDGTHTFQTFADARKNARLARVLHGTFAEHADKLADLNGRGAGVFVAVNETDGHGRKAENVTGIRAYFADLDGAPLEPVRAAPLRPHCTVESSPGRWHAYWLVSDAPLATFKMVQRAIAARFGSDPAVCDLPRVMRIPGYLHLKAEPFQSRIVELHDFPRYQHAEFIRAFGIDTAAPVGSKPVASATSAPTRPAHKLAATIPEGKRNSTLLSLAGGLARRGFVGGELNRRIQKLNAERCVPPLGTDEVDAICTRAATAYGSIGFVILPHRMLDAPAWRDLSPPAKALVLAGFRRAGSPHGTFALPFTEFRGQPGFRADRGFYAARDEAIVAGFLTVHTQSRRTQQGCTAALFTISPDALNGSLTCKKPVSGEFRYPAKRQSALTCKKHEVLKSLTDLCVGVCVSPGTHSTESLARMFVLADHRPFHIPSVSGWYALPAEGVA